MKIYRIIVHDLIVKRNKERFVDEKTLKVLLDESNRNPKVFRVSVLENKKIDDEQGRIVLK